MSEDDYALLNAPLQPARLAAEKSAAADAFGQPAAGSDAENEVYRCGEGSGAPPQSIRTDIERPLLVRKAGLGDKVASMA